MKASSKILWLGVVVLYLAVFVGGAWVHGAEHSGHGVVSEAKDCGVCFLVSNAHAFGVVQAIELPSALICDSFVFERDRFISAVEFSISSARAPPVFLS